jgi:Protein of unknown function (DUF3011)
MKNYRRWTAIAVIFTMGVLCPLATAQQGTMNCASNDGRYRYCRVDTQNYVRLTRQNSGSPCTYGRTWGYDYRGIWVDRGCRATFEYGRRQNNNGGSNTGAAVAAGILGAIIVGSAIAASKNDDNNNDDTAELRQQYYRDGYRHGERDWDNDRNSYYRAYSDRYPPRFENDFAEGYNDGYNNRPSRYR